MKEGRAIAIYNADEQRLIGLFANGTMAAQFIYGRYKAGPPSRNIAVRVRNKSRITPKVSQHTFNIAVRNANTTQILELNGKDYLLKDESLSEHLKSISKGFDSTAIEYAIVRKARPHNTGISMLTHR